MNFLTPPFFVAGALAIPIVILYLLRRQRPLRTVSSTLLWQQLVRDQTANRPWQKLQRNWLLLLQLLALAGLVLALARPFRQVPVWASGAVTVLLDGSASMQAHDVEPSRFAVAQQMAQQILQQLPANTPVTLVVVQGQPQVLASAETDPAKIRQLLRQAQPSNAVANWQAAFALAIATARNAPSATTVILSDGGLPSDLPGIPGQVRYLPIGAAEKPARNLALTGLSLRDAPNGAVELFAQVRNYGQEPYAATLSLYLDGTLFNARLLNVAAGATESIVLDASAANAIHATLTPLAGETTLDDLAIDDQAWAVYRSSSRGRVLLVGAKPNRFLEQVLAAIPNMQAFRATADKLPSEVFDLYVFDGVLPAVLPNAPFVLFNPPVDTPFLQVDAAQAVPTKPVWQIEKHPLNQFVDWEGVAVAQLSPVVPRPDFQTKLTPLVSLAGHGLVWAGQPYQQRAVVFAFDLHASDLPLRVAFPLLFANLRDWLLPGTVIRNASETILPSEPVSIQPDVAASVLLVQAPDGERYAAALSSEGATAIFAQTEQLGIYQVVSANSTQFQSARAFAVNLYSPLESAIALRSTLQIGSQAVAASNDQQGGEHEYWQWFAGVGLLLLILEWIIHLRQNHWALPSLPAWSGVRRKA